MHEYDPKAWKRLEATVSALTTFTAYSTYADHRAANSTAALPADGSTGGHRIVYIARETPKNRVWIMRSGST